MVIRQYWRIKKEVLLCPLHTICRKTEHDRAEAIIDYIERIRRTLFRYLDAPFSPNLKDDAQLTNDLEEAISPMYRKRDHQSGYNPKVRLCTVIRIELPGIRKKRLKLGSKMPMNLQCR